VWLGLNPAHTARELAHVLGDARPRIVLGEARLPVSAKQALREAAAAADRPPPTEVEPAGVATAFGHAPIARADDLGTADDLARRGVAIIVYTSGSTGRPKGALVTHRGLAENGWWLARRLGFEPLRTLLNLPINHIGCVGDVAATVLVGGGTLVCMERFDAAAAVRLLAEQRIACLAQVPAQVLLMLERGGLQRAHLAGVRHLLWGGAAMPEPALRELLDAGPSLISSYGLTECSGTITFTGPEADLATLRDTVGRPVAEGRLRIAADDGSTLPEGSEGEVQLSGPHLFAGYLNAPQATAAAFAPDGWLRTGDHGRLDAAGQLRLLGRRHEMFKSGGYNVYPREVEAVIEALPGVDLCAVISVPDPTWSEVGIAFVQASAALDEDALRRHCAQQLARYKVPKRFVLRPALPLLPIGKVDKQRLRAELLAVGT
jgi:acyl-CoA synthetase (AMP-forming)/AMP-acid ligase II